MVSPVVWIIIVLGLIYLVGRLYLHVYRRAPEATATTKKPDPKKPPHPRDPAREVIETVVFVVVLVLLLKLFVTEAFVIPTGSMAETLYGYQKIVTCPKCGHEFPVNSHDEVEGRQGDRRKMPLFGYCCPNCRYQGQIREFDPAPVNRTGDRVLVLKPLFHVRRPERGDVVVFKFPEKPQENFEAANYIKRAMGFGGETIAIYRGELFVTTFLTYPPEKYPRPDNALELWQPEHMYSNTPQNPDANPDGLKLFEASRARGFPPGANGFGTAGFEIVRKGEGQLLADRRLVWDNDRQPTEFAQHNIPSRWFDAEHPASWPGAWKPDSEVQPKAFAHSGDGENWIRYRHLAMAWKTLPADRWDGTLPTNLAELATQRPTQIDNFLGYNSGREQDPLTGAVGSNRQTQSERLWVGDLILECEADVADGGTVTLELSKGINRFRAIFGNGKVRLERVEKDGVVSQDFGQPERPCDVAAGKHNLRFANVDCRLWVWVDDDLIDFGEEGDYLPPTPAEEGQFTDFAPDELGRRIKTPGVQTEGWTYQNDVDAPASIGAKGQVTIRGVKLHRDIYYTPRTSTDWSDPTVPVLYYVQPGHYLCLGDNSAHSSDSRSWGTVPERLMLGKAVFVFYPISLDWQWGWPPVSFNPARNRVGFIK